MPARFSTAHGGEAAIEGPWWESFGDPDLNAVVATALRDNLDLAQGESRIDRARALVRQARAVQFPQANLLVDGDRRWTREVHRDTPGSDPLGTVNQVTDIVNMVADIVQGTPSLSVPAGPDREPPRNSYFGAYSVGLSLSWEADLWGRLRDAKRSQREQLVALGFEYDALRLFLSAQVAETYYQIVEQNQLLALLEDQLELAATFLDLIELRFLQGDASAVDVLQQRGQLAEIEAEIPIARSQLGLLENRLDVLMGLPPDGVDRVRTDTAELPTTDDFPAIGVPLGLLVHRPDLLAAQRRVVAQDYEIAVAIAERLPQLTLNGSFTYTDPTGANTLVALGAASLFQPLLDWGLRKAQVDAARAVFEESLLAFSQNYLIAIEEVETTLWQEARQRELIDATVNLENILSRTVDETRSRYSLGVTDYLPVLTALQDLQRVQRELIQQRRNLVSFRIQLYRAIGGPTSARPAPERWAANRLGSDRGNSLN